MKQLQALISIIIQSNLGKAVDSMATSIDKATRDVSKDLDKAASGVSRDVDVAVRGVSKDLVNTVASPLVSSIMYIAIAVALARPCKMQSECVLLARSCIQKNYTSLQRSLGIHARVLVNYHSIMTYRIGENFR